MSAPFKILAALLDSDTLDLDKDEEARLSVTGALAANDWLPHINSRYITLSAFLSTFAAIMGTKFVFYRRERRLKDKEQKPPVSAPAVDTGKPPNPYPTSIGNNTTTLP